MPITPGMLEIDLRHHSVQSIIRKLERTTGLFFNIRRARVTSTRSHCFLEIVGGSSAPPSSA
jgi:hypothetical protein